MFQRFENEVKQAIRAELIKEGVQASVIDKAFANVFSSSASGAGATATATASAPTAIPQQLPLLIKKDILAQEEKFKNHLAKIQATLGLPVEVQMVPDFDWLGINESQKDNQGWYGKPGQIWERLLGHLSNNIATLAKTDMSKEAVVGAWTTGLIRLIINPKLKWPNSSTPKSWDEVFVDGVLEISCTNPLLSEGQIGKWIESHL